MHFRGSFPSLSPLCSHSCPTLGFLFPLCPRFVPILVYLLVMLLHGGCGTLERPTGRGPDGGKFCIWISGLIRRLLQGRDFQLVRMLQGPLGQYSAKPTTMLAMRLPWLSAYVYQHYDCGWRPSMVLGGLDECGEWTSKGRNIPIASATLWQARTFTTSRNAMCYLRTPIHFQLRRVSGLMF